MEKTPLKILFRRNQHTVFNQPFAASFSIAVFLSATPVSAVSVSVGVNPAPPFAKTSVKPKTKPSTKEPVLLTAEHVDYDKDTSQVSASGKVEIVQGETILLADHVLYDQENNVVTANGNVSILDASGNVVFADSLELKDDLKSGIINQFKARLADKSLFAANRARKIDENRTELHQAVYSPCKVCMAKEGGKAPLWQLHADRVLIDKQEQEVTYKNAFMEVYGFPVIYTPYFSHPTPRADNKSGLLEPTFKQSTNLGFVYRQPVYYSIAQDRDVTITPIYTTIEGPVLAGEYRQLFNNGAMEFDGSITKPQTRDAGGINSKGQNWRGHFNAEGYFSLDEQTSWGFNIRRTSDDTYLRRYDFSEDTLLTSRIYAEKHDFIGDGGRSFAQAQALKFDGLTAADNARTAPLILPLADFNWESAPGFHDSRFFVDSNLMALTREDGPQSRRLSNTAGWKLPYITSDGQVIEFASQIRADIYSVSDQPLGNGEYFNGQTGRILPQASLTWRYPFINQWENGNILVEPIAMFAISPNSGNSNKIPNEDSQVPEFNASNLFNPNRFSGYDRVETGAQMSYGLRGQAQIYSNKYIDWLFGQHYHRDTASNFPFSNDKDSNFSDFVGKIGLNYDPFSIAYRVRLDKDSLAFNQNEVTGTINYYPVVISTSYLSLKNDPTLQNKEEIAGSLGINLTKEWIWGVSAIKDLELGNLTSASTSLTFSNECISIINSFGRNYTFDRDIKPATTFTFRVSFKNLD
jgi:LPS-assembly protein